MTTGTYKESLPCGGELNVTSSSWEISYYFPGPDLRYNGEFVRVPGNLIEEYISAYNENWTEYVRLKSAIPVGADFTKPGKMGMMIRIGKFAQGVCIRAYHMPIASTTQLERLISGFRYARQRAAQIQRLLATL